MKKVKNAHFSAAVAALCAVIFMLVVPAPAVAHTQLVSTHPADGESVGENIEEIELVFSDDVLAASTLQVTDGQGATIPLKNVQAEGNRISGFPETPLPAGVYTVAWKAASSDGHVIEGKFSFTVEASEQMPGDSGGEPGDAAGGENGASEPSGGGSSAVSGDGGPDAKPVLSETKRQESRETAAAAEPAEADESKFSAWLIVLIGAALALVVLVLAFGRKRA
jgi:methionine-rich copper-binding protein CopC